MYRSGFNPSMLPPPMPPPQSYEMINRNPGIHIQGAMPPPPPPPLPPNIANFKAEINSSSALPIVSAEYVSKIAGDTNPPPPPPPPLPPFSDDENDYDPSFAAENNYDPFEAANNFKDTSNSSNKNNENHSSKHKSEDFIASLTAAEKELETERANHVKRVAIENKKRRFGSKLSGGLRKSAFTASSRQIESKRIKAVFDDSDEETDMKLDSQSTTAADIASLKEDVRITVKGTAEWVVNNSVPAVESLLLRARDDPRLSFIFDKAGATPAGRYYKECLDMAKTRSEVHKVTSGIVDFFPSLHQMEAERIKKEKEELKAAAAKAALEAAQKKKMEVKAEAERQRAELQRKKAEAEAEEQRQEEKKLIEKAAAAAAILTEEAEIARLGESERRSYEVAAAAAVIILEQEAENLSATFNTMAAIKTNHENLLPETQDDSIPKPRRSRWGSNAVQKLIPVKKSRWGNKNFTTGEGDVKTYEDSTVAISNFQNSTALAMALAPNTPKIFSSPLLPKQLPVLPETVDAETDKQLREQKELQRIEARIREAALRQMFDVIPAGISIQKQSELHEERLREYEELAARADEDFKDTIEMAEENRGVIEGGTWEHRKRAKEMLSTAEAARALTLSAARKGGSHLGNYLPPEELDRFLKESQAITSGIILKDKEDFEKNKLDESNLGYRLLQKAGWNEGEGLGKDGAGSAVPVNMNSAGDSGGGLGTTAVGAVESTDTEYDLYRKRMMLAYKFRPNPLNNPRRSYY